ncbi:MAG TPA: alpha/beta hydrolase [Streptosporangiaceae bacterium]
MNKKKGLIGAAVGVAAAGVAGAVAAQRIAVGRLRTRPDPAAGEPLGSLRGRPVEVRTDDGVVLYAEVDGREDADLTVVFSHGWTLNQDSWHYQRRDLADRARLVFYDHRDHGRSGRGATKPVTMERLADDLFDVIAATVPSGGRIVLVGHSMGGMTIMALAERHPELFGDRVVGTALVGTSPGRLAEVTLGLPMIAGKAFRATVPSTLAALGRAHGVIDRGRAYGGDLAFLGMRYIGFGDPDTSPTVIDFSEQMIRSTPMDVIADYYPVLMAHDKQAALDVLARVPTLIVSGTRDRLTPPEHSAAMAEAIPSAHFVSIAGAGHMVMLEQPALVTDALRHLLDRSRAAGRTR